MDPMVIRFPGGKRVDSEYEGRVICTDQPREQGGEGSAPEPFTLFLASLGTCAGFYVLAFCQAREISTVGLRIEQWHDVDPDTHKLVAVRQRIVLPVGFPEKYVGAIRQAAAACKVKKTLAAPPVIEVEAVVASQAAQ